MKKIFVILLMVIMTGKMLFSQNAIEIAKSSIPSTVAIVMEDKYKQPISIGSGFIVGNGKIVTNVHVIKGASYGYVNMIGSNMKYKIQGYLAIDKLNDVVILSVPTLSSNPLSLTGDQQPEIGEKIYAIGNPSGLSGTISEGIVSGIRTISQKKLIQITAPISPGSSGGPVINNYGHVIGIAVGTLTSGQNLNFAIPASYVQNMLNNQSSNVTALNIPKNNTSTKSASGEKDIKEGVYVRNVKFETGIWDSEGTRENHRVLQSFSIKNDTPYYIYGVKIMYIVYDKTGIPIDYYEDLCCTLPNANGKYGIKPFMALTIDEFKMGIKRAMRLENNFEKLEIRILDFYIQEDE